MSKEEITKLLTEKFSGKITPFEVKNVDAAFFVDKEEILEVCKFLKENPKLDFDFLNALFGIDYPDKGEIQIDYILFSFKQGHKLVLKVILPREKPEINSITSIWSGANWHERETGELFGVKFLGHPDFRPLLLAEDWNEGFPMRRDWTGAGTDFVKLPDK
jgi:NADH:ubiquinone oxidoreductase subunit C